MKVALSFDRSAERNVADRAGRLIRKGPPEGLGDLATSVQFLRGVSSRATFALSAFYLRLATDESGKNRCTVVGYPGKVLQAQIHFSSMNTIALACRKAFDNGSKMTGATFGRMTDAVLKEHAQYWSKHSRRSEDDAFQALRFLRALFRQHSKKPETLFSEGGSTLGRRIGFIKQYADYSAAHLTLDNYEFDSLDLAHVVAALALIGSIICSFDTGCPLEYFDEIDQAGHAAAMAMFPDAEIDRLFQFTRIYGHAQALWELPESEGLGRINESLPYALGWF